ncbi:hypothetical protein DBV15_05744 [Temnothorax longispinosus]|uniref:Uncharacterized protein n=1 Tax=Temnothorax longispinosus TaxID=300112 RepID=A0A4S2KF66_9HYME|nr:hypothetical protein DBV15_05744 [Temnothorax longispinosus]
MAIFRTSHVLFMLKRIRYKNARGKFICKIPKYEATLKVLANYARLVEAFVSLPKRKCPVTTRPTARTNRRDHVGGTEMIASRNGAENRGAAVGAREREGGSEKKRDEARDRWSKQKHDWFHPPGGYRRGDDLSENRERETETERKKERDKSAILLTSDCRSARVVSRAKKMSVLQSDGATLSQDTLSLVNEMALAFARTSIMITRNLSIDGVLQYEEATKKYNGLVGAALFGRVPRRGDDEAGEHDGREIRRASASCALSLYPGHFHRRRRCRRRRHLPPGARDRRWDFTEQQVLPARCLRPAPKTSQPSRVSDVRPRGGNCPEAMQPPHSSADRATSDPPKPRESFDSARVNASNASAIPVVRPGERRYRSSRCRYVKERKKLFSNAATRKTLQKVRNRGPRETWTGPAGVS